MNQHSFHRPIPPSGRHLRYAFAVLAVTAAIPIPLVAQEVPEDFVLTLERDWISCGAPCPGYSVSINARGDVTYHGTKYVRVEGTVVDKVPISRVRELLLAVERLEFFELQDRYISVDGGDGHSWFVTHDPTAFVTVTRNGQTKRIEDNIGLPDGLRELERQIDDAARTQRWVRIDVMTLRQMVETGNSPSADELSALLSSALHADEVDVIQELLAIGANPHRIAGNEHHGATQPLLIVRSAAAARALLEAGAEASAPNEFGNTPLWNTVGLPPDVAEVLLKAGAPVDMAVDRFGQTALMRAAAEGNIGVVRLLLSAGANPAHRAEWGSALDLARSEKAREGRSRVPSVLRTTGFERDFDAVIVALEAALNTQR